MKYFITSTGTGIGKTLVTTSLCYQLKKSGAQVSALKPAISGYDALDLSNDSAQIVASLGIEPTAQAQEAISPWRYNAPLAPNMAAAKEGHPINFHELISFCQKATGDILLVEGVGGLMAPITDQHTVLDWMVELGWPIIMTAGSYLGTISHTLTAIEALRARNLPLHALIICESENSTVPLDETLTALRKFIPAKIPIVKIPRIATTEQIWKLTPNISWLCQNPQK